MDLNNADDGGAGAGGGDAGTIDDLGLGGGGDGGAGDGGGDAGAGGDGGSGGGDGATADFLAQFSTDLGDGETASNQDYIKAKGFKDLDGIVKAYRAAEKGLHDTGRVKIPGEDATDQEVADYRKAIGVPDAPDGYERPEFKDKDGNVIAYNTDLADRIFERAHKIGLPKDAAEQLLAGEIEQQIADFDEQIASVEADAAKHVKGWGEDKDAKLAQVNAALKDLNFSREDVQHLRMLPSGVGAFLDAMAKVGTNFTEDGLIKGDRGSFGMDPQEAQKEIDEMMADPDVSAKMLVDGSPENKRYNRLLAAAGQATVDN